MPPRILTPEQRIRQRYHWEGHARLPALRDLAEEVLQMAEVLDRIPRRPARSLPPAAPAPDPRSI